jgi:hypothetical protein
VTLFWQSNKDGFISVSPDVLEIGKNQSAAVKLRFNPLLEFQFMGATLEGFAQYREMRNAKVVDFPTLPFLLTPFVDGHTMDDVTSFIPTMRTSHKTLVFAGALSGDCKFQTFIVENRGDCAFKYDTRIIEASPADPGTVQSSSTAFTVYPQVGTIHKGSFQIFVVKFSPSQRGHYHAQLFAGLNDAPMNSFSVNLKGDASVPGVTFSVTGTLFLHPVSLGSISTHTIQIANDATVPVRIEWKIPSLYQSLLIVNPQVCEIKSKEVIDCEWAFHPDTVGEFKSEVVCNVQALPYASNEFVAKDLLPFIVGPDSVHLDSALASSLKSVQHYPLTICTLVTDCIVKSKPQTIEFGFVRINSTAVSTLSISNHSDSQMHFVLQTKSRPLQLVQFAPADDILPPRSSCSVEVRFTPRAPGEVTDTILCSLLNENTFQTSSTNMKSVANFAIKTSMNEICKVTGMGCFPHLSIVDIFSPKYSRRVTWAHSEVNEINTELDLLGCNSLTDDLKTFQIDFGFDTVDSEPSAIHIAFKNVGHIAFSFSVNFPNDISIDPEYWALPDEVDPNQLKQDQIMQAKLFRVSEKKFHLEPSETTTVVFTYVHKFVESHQLPVVLSIQNGRIIRLNLRGVTLDPTVPHLVPDTEHFRLQPVAIGAMEPPIQMLRVFNASQADAEYRIDLTQVQEVAEQNHNFDVFRFLNPTGVIRARSDGYFTFVFKPLEPIEYQVSVLCLVASGNNFAFMLTGSGVHIDHDPCELSWPLFPPRSLAIAGAAVVTLSEQFLDFGDVPVLVRVDRMLFMTNGGDVPLEFEAELPSEVLKLDPRKGMIGAHSQLTLTLRVEAPPAPTVLQTTIPIAFSKPEVRESPQRRPSQAEAVENEIIAADPPIDKVTRRPRKSQDRWKSVGERTLEAAAGKQRNNDSLFSTHIGQRGSGVSPRKKAAHMQFLDILVNAMSREDYRDKYGSVDTFAFEVENTVSSASETHGQNEEIAEILGGLVDSVISDEQEQRLALRDAKLRHEHVPLFAQLYRADPVVEVEQQTVENQKVVDDIEGFLHGVINEIMIEANAGTFPLTKEILHVAGFRDNE